MLARAGEAQGPTDPWPWEGPYSPIPLHGNPGPSEHCCEIAHAILIATGPMQGRVLLIQSNSDRWMWDPAAPRSVGTEQLCDVVVPPTDNMFCAGHSADGNGDIVMIGGSRYKKVNPPSCSAQPTYSYVFDTGPACWSGNLPLLVPVPAPQNFGYYYPSSARLPDGSVISVGGGSDPLSSLCGDTGSTYFLDGWLRLDPSTSTWVGATPTMWFDGLPGTYQTASGPIDLHFTYYPLLSVLPSTTATSPGYVFAPVVTDLRHGNYMDVPGFVPKRSPSA